jgi:hypothetical protein
MTFHPTDQDGFLFRTPVLFLAVAVALGVLGGCDTANVGSEGPSDPSSEAQVTGDSFEKADLTYAPVSLAPGETFSIELADDRLDRGVARLVHEGTPEGGQELRARFDYLQPSSVTVTCRNVVSDRERKITSLEKSTAKAGTGLVATSDREPNSFHYIDNGDNIVVEVDYETESVGGSVLAPTVEFPSSDQTARCTHVGFVLENVSIDLSADGVRFGGDVAAPRIRDKNVR